MILTDSRLKFCNSKRYFDSGPNYESFLELSCIHDCPLYFSCVECGRRARGAWCENAAGGKGGCEIGWWMWV